MNQQFVGLQAAQAAYSKIAQLSLFDYFVIRGSGFPRAFLRAIGKTLPLP